MEVIFRLDKRFDIYINVNKLIKSSKSRKLKLLFSLQSDIKGNLKVMIYSRHKNVFVYRSQNEYSKNNNLQNKIVVLLWFFFFFLF